MNRAKLLDRRPTSHTAGSILVATDVMLHGLPHDTIANLREATRQGLTPLGIEFSDDGSIAMIRFARPNAGEASLMVGVEFNAEDNEVVGKIYDAKSVLKHATEPRDAHLDGSVRATVSRLLRELAAKIAGDESF